MIGGVSERKVSDCVLSCVTGSAAVDERQCEESREVRTSEPSVCSL